MAASLYDDHDNAAFWADASSSLSNLALPVEKQYCACIHLDNRYPYTDLYTHSLDQKDLVYPSHTVGARLDHGRPQQKSRNSYNLHDGLPL